MITLTILISVHLGLNVKVIKIVNILQNSTHSLQSNDIFIKKQLNPKLLFYFVLSPPYIYYHIFKKMEYYYKMILCKYYIFSKNHKKKITNLTQ